MYTDNERDPHNGLYLSILINYNEINFKIILNYIINTKICLPVCMYVNNRTYLNEFLYRDMVLALGEDIGTNKVNILKMFILKVRRAVML